MSAFATGARGAGAVADGAQGVRAGSAAADAATAGSKGFKFTDEAFDLSQMGPTLNKMSVDEFKVALDNDNIVTFLNVADSNDLVTVLKGIDSKKLATIGKKLDSTTIDALRKVDGGADLAKKLDPSSAKKLSYTQQAKNAATAFTKASAAKLKGAQKSIKKFISGAGNPPKDFDGVEESTKALNKTDGSVGQVSETMAKNHGGNGGDAAKALSDTGKVLEDGSKSSKSLKKALAELGITPGSVAIGAGVIVLLCMAYDTDNPFTAVDRALDDTGKVVKGFKEVADEAAEAVKDTAKGGFDFISFVTNNSWISSACSILCVILLFALFTMGLLGSMGGGNNKGR